jgi:cystathionine beta-lyase/cystathionine gamma-synthase
VHAGTIERPALGPEGDEDGGTEELLRASLADLEWDFDELAHIVDSVREALARNLEDLEAAGRHIRSRTRRALRGEIGRFAAVYTRYGEELQGLRRAARTARPCESLLGRLTEAKAGYADLLRTHHAIAASLATASDWQSPSFLHSVESMAGRHTGKVREHEDDYKRDRHPDAAAFERAYLREYVDNPHRLELRALMTSCGMAAFTTILGLALRHRTERRPVLIGRRIYHECRQLLRLGFGHRAIEVDERDVASIARTIAAARPSAVFLDSQCNSKGLILPDLDALLRTLPETGDLLLVIDNTGRSCTFQPFAGPPAAGSQVVAFESLTKYAQLGMDRTTAGIIVAPGPVAGALSDLREHLGTNVADVSSHMVPVPSRAILERRLSRLDRNAMLLAASLCRHVGRSPRRAVKGICHPCLDGHPSHRVARTLSFRGGLLAIEFRAEADHADTHRAFVRSAIAAAARRGVPLTAGASFGLNTTRVYHTASTSQHGDPFVRVAVGTEHRLGVQAVARVFAEAIDDLDRSGSTSYAARRPIPSAVTPTASETAPA